MLTGYLEGYVYAAVAAIIAALFGLVVYGIVRIVAPSRPYAEKRTTYECGVAPIGEPWIPFRIQYYVFALLFLIFDIETIFIFPWAIIYRKLGWFGWLEMLVFVVILLFGLVYAWVRKVLKWV